MYNEEDNHIDELFRSTFAGHEETPPPSAWNNIVETRSFGHVLLNQIALNWKNFLFMTIGFMFVGAGVIGFGSAENDHEPSHATYLFNKEQLYGGHDFGGMLLAYNGSSGSASGNGSRSYYSQVMPSHLGQYEVIRNRMKPSIPSTTNNPMEPTYHHKSIGPFRSTETIHKEANDVSRSARLTTKNANDYRTKEDHASLKSSQTIDKKATANQRWKKKAAINHTIVGADEPTETASYTSHASLGHIASLNPFKINKVSRLEAGAPISIDSLYYNAKRKKRISLKNHMYVSFQMGPQIMDKNLSASQPENNVYLNKRNASEQTAMGGSVQANLTYYFFNNVFVETGVRYSRFNERITYDEMNITSQRTVLDSAITGYTVGPTGNPVPIYDISSRTVYETELINREQNNTYHMVDIPLLLGYQIDVQRWSVYLKSGITPTIFKRQSGYVLGEGESTQLDFGGDDDPYRSGMLLNLEVAGGVSYQLDETIHLLVEPNFRSNISSLHKGNYPLTEKRKILGILAGIRIKL